MTAMADGLENAILDLILRGTALTGAGFSPGTVYAGLFVTPTTDSGGGAEVAGGGYSRTQVPSFSVPVGGVTSNSSLVNFPTASTAWGIITHFALFDAAVGGNLLFHGPLTIPKVTNAGDSFVFPVGNITVSID